MTISYDELEERINETVFRALRSERPAIAREVQGFVREGWSNNQVRDHYAGQLNIAPWLLDAIEITANRFRECKFSVPKYVERDNIRSAA